MTEIATIEPGEIVVGDLITWKRSLSDYPANSSWVLAYTLINSTHKITITTTASGSDHLVSIAAATSALYNAGVYQWQAVVTKALEKYTIATGEMTVKPSFAAASTLDTRSDAKKTLDAIETEILARATGGMTQEYTIGNRSLKKAPMSDLILLRDKYRAIYASEQNAERVAKGLAGRNRILVRL